MPLSEPVILGTGTIATVVDRLSGRPVCILKDDVITVAAADPVVERARSVAAQYDIPEVYASLERDARSLGHRPRQSISRRFQYTVRRRGKPAKPVSTW